MSGRVLIGAGVGASFGSLCAAAYSPVWIVFFLLGIGLIGFGVGFGRGY